MLNLLFFTVKLLNYSPDLIETVCVNKTTNKLNGNCVWNFILVLRCDIPITDRNHCCGSPINRVRVLSDPISLRNRFLVKLYRNRPTTFKTVVENTTLFTQIITDVKKSTCNDIAQHKNFCQKQKQLQCCFHSSVHIVQIYYTFLHID